MSRFNVMPRDDVNAAAWALVDYVITVTHNADGDELEGCRICNPDGPFTHRKDCPMPALIEALMKDSER